MKIYFYNPPSQQGLSAKERKAKHLAYYHSPVTVTGMPRRRQLELQYEVKSFINRDISLVIPDFGSLLVLVDVDSFDSVAPETVVTPPSHVKKKIPREGELVVINEDSSTEGWFLYMRCFESRVLPNLVEVRYFTTPYPALENYEHCSVEKRSERLSERFLSNFVFNK